MHLAFSKTGRLLKGDLLHYVPLITLQHHTTCSYIICVSDAIYSQATLDGDIGLFLRKTNKSVPPLSLLSFGVSLYLRRASWLNPVKDVLRALRYHLRDPVPLQLVEHPGNVLRVACVSISVSSDCDT